MGENTQNGLVNVNLQPVADVANADNIDSDQTDADQTENTETLPE